METVLQDCAYARSLFVEKPHSSPLSCSRSRLALARTTAIFSVVNANSAAPAAFQGPQPHRHVWLDNRKAGVDQDWHSYPNYVDYCEQNSTFEQIAAFNDRSFQSYGRRRARACDRRVVNCQPVLGAGVDPVQDERCQRGEGAG